MANEGSAFGAVLPGWRMRLSLGDAGFLAFLLLVFVSLMPFEVRNANALLHGADTNEAGSGNLGRQISYLAVFALIGIAATRARGARVIHAVPVAIGILLAWCIISATWAVEPSVTLRRAALECIVVLCAFLSVDTLGAERSLTLLRWVLTAVLIVNWLSIPFVPQAIHLPGEADPGLVGDWRGLYFHKNIAGSVSAISALVFFFTFLETRRWREAGLFAAATAFTAMTHSKTSIALLPFALILGTAYRFAWRRPLDRQIALVALALIAFVVAAVTLFEWSALRHVLANPDELTGRAAIWQAELDYIADHPFLGSGFGSFAHTGAASPLRHYIGSAWIANVSHGHSGYLQLLVTIGGIGFALAITSLIAMPALQFLKTDTERLALRGILFAIFIFIIFHNIVESDYLEGDSTSWVAFLLALAMLKAITKTRQP